MIPMRSVLELVGFEPTEGRGDQLRGCCPLLECPHHNRREFSVHRTRDIFYCFTCDQSGNQLDLWAAFQSLEIYDAAKDLCERTNNEVPWLKHRLNSHRNR